MTGATGFLGSTLLRRLMHEGYEITILKRSFSNTHRINDLLPQVQCFDLDKIDIPGIAQRVKAHYIIHCATDYGRKNISIPEVIQTNLLLPASLLALREEFGCKCFVNTDTIIDKRVSVYSKSKNQFREWLEYFSKEIVAVNVALEHFYGAGDDKSKFISMVMDKLLSNHDEINLTAGEQLRDFIYIDDVVEAFVLILKHVQSANNGFYNFEIGTNELFSIRSVVELIKDFTGNTATRLNFGALPYRDNELMASAVNTENIRKLGWIPKYQFADGLKYTIANEKKLRDKYENTN
jgi:nucleoside-diphosphate-sugar epimerase